jgi:hypothetical protein
MIQIHVDVTSLFSNYSGVNDKVEFAFRAKILRVTFLRVCQNYVARVGHSTKVKVLYTQEYAN